MLLEHLQKTYPLPCNEPLEYFHETQTIADLKFELLGVATHTHGKQVTGSAVGFDVETTLLRSYFELLERATLVAAPATVQAVHAATTPQWRLALSNGVAAHTNPQLAKLAACNELFERDQILRSWFGQNKPMPVNIKQTLEFNNLGRLLTEYTIDAFSINATPSSVRPYVIGVFAWPKNSDKCPAYGFGCHTDKHIASSKALDECVQRLCFLYDCPVPEAPLPSPTPDMHQDYFLSVHGQVLLKRWLEGNHDTPILRLQTLEQLTTATMTLKNITPPDAEGKYHVFRASSAHAIPLYFGYGPDCPGEALFGPLGEDRRIHPIC